MTTLNSLIETGTWATLSGKARAIMGVLLVKAVDGTCRLNKRDLIEATRLSDPAVTHAIEELIEANLIDRRHEFTSGGRHDGFFITIK